MTWENLPPCGWERGLDHSLRVGSEGSDDGLACGRERGGFLVGEGRGAKLRGESQGCSRGLEEGPRVRRRRRQGEG